MDKKRSDTFFDHIQELYSTYTTYDYYKILGIEQDDPVEKIKTAFFNAELKYHPDMYVLIDEDIKIKLVEIYSYINSAYLTLTDPQKRREYDRNIKKTKRREVVISDVQPRMSMIRDDIQQNESNSGSLAPGMSFADNSNNAKVRFRDGKVAFWDNDFNKAARLFEMAKEFDCSVAEYHFMYGSALIKLGRNKEAVQALNRANELKPSDPDTLAELGHAYLNLGFPLRAVKYFKHVSRIDPSHRRAREGVKKAG